MSEVDRVAEAKSPYANSSAPIARRGFTGEESRWSGPQRLGHRSLETLGDRQSTFSASGPLRDELFTADPAAALVLPQLKPPASASAARQPVGRAARHRRQRQRRRLDAQLGMTRALLAEAEDCPPRRLGPRFDRLRRRRPVFATFCEIGLNVWDMAARLRARARSRWSASAISPVATACRNHRQHRRWRRRHRSGDVVRERSRGTDPALGRRRNRRNGGSRDRHIAPRYHPGSTQRCFLALVRLGRCTDCTRCARPQDRQTPAPWLAPAPDCMATVQCRALQPGRMLLADLSLPQPAPVDPATRQLWRDGDAYRFH